MAPKGWRKAQLKEILDGTIKNGFSPVAADIETGYWVLGLGALSDGCINASEKKPVLPEDKVIQTLLKHGDFLVSRSNTPDKVGRSVRFLGEVENCSYPDLMMKFRVNEKKANPLFIEQKLKSSSIRTYFKNCAAGSSSTMVKINKGILEKTPLLLPELSEQIRIAQVLSTWDKAITTTERLLVNNQRQRKALMQQLLTGKKRLLDKNGIRFGGEWINTKLGKLIKEIKKENEPNPDSIELLTVKLHNKGVIRSGKFPKSTDGGRPYHRRFEGELIIGRQNLHNGGVAIVTKECDGLIASNAISSFEAMPFANTNFILAIMSTDHFKFVIDNLAGGTGQKEIGVKDLLKVRILIPVIEEQQRIATVIFTADQEINVLQKNLECLKQEKKALMQQLLTGKRRVTID